MEGIPLATNLHLSPSPTRHINERVKALWAAGETVYHFGFGESRFPVHPSLVTALRANADCEAYPPVQGLGELREAMAAYYSRTLGLAFGAEQVLVGPGSKALLFALQMALDADLLLPTPSWVNYAPQARLLGKRIISIRGRAEDGYAIRIDQLREAAAEAGPRPRMLIVNNPNNPTGRTLADDELRALAETCRELGIVVISDEIYGLLPHARQAHVTLAHHYPEGTIIVGGLSNHLSLGGWRLGKVIVPAGRQDLIWILNSIAAEIWSSVSAPIQHAAVTAYAGDPHVEAYIAECAHLHGLRTHYIWRRLHQLGVRVAEPDGGFYLLPNFDRWREPLARRGVKTSLDLAHFLLDQYRIATLPGYAFGIPAGELSLRVATSFIDMETDDKAQRLLTRWRAHRDQDLLLTENMPLTAAAMEAFARFITELNGEL